MLRIIYHILKVPNFKSHLFNPKKTLPWRERRLMTYCAWDVSKYATCGRDEERKKGLKLSCVKLAICPDHPRRHRPLKFCMRGRVREVLYISSFMKIGRGVSELCEAENLSLSLSLSLYLIDKAHGLYNRFYYRTRRDIHASVAVRNQLWWAVALSGFRPFGGINVVAMSCDAIAQEGPCDCSTVQGYYY